jgi:hypothetical protein
MRTADQLSLNTIDSENADAFSPAVPDREYSNFARS